MALLRGLKPLCPRPALVLAATDTAPTTSLRGARPSQVQSPGRRKGPSSRQPFLERSSRFGRNHHTLSPPSALLPPLLPTHSSIMGLFDFFQDSQQAQGERYPLVAGTTRSTLRRSLCLAGKERPDISSSSECDVV